MRLIEERLLPLRAVLASTQTTLDSLIANWDNLTSCTSDSSLARPQDKDLLMIRDCQSYVGSYVGNLQHLLRRTKSAIDFLSETLNFSNQRTEKEQTKLLLRLSISAKEDSATVQILTVVTLVYLSFTSVAVCIIVFLLQSDRTALILVTDNYVNAALLP